MVKQPYLLGLCGLAGSGKDTVADHLVRHHRYVKVSFADPLKRICKDVFDFTDEQLWGPSSKRNASDYRYPRSIKEHLDEKTGTVTTVEEDFLTARYALQLLGTEWGRQCYPAVWVEYALRTARKIMEEGCTYTVQKGLSQPARSALTGGSTLAIDVGNMIFERQGTNTSIDVNAIQTLIEKGIQADSPMGVVIADVRFKNEIAAIKKVGGRVIRVRPPEQGALAEWQMHASEMEQFTMSDDDFDAVVVNPKKTFEALYADVDRVMASLK